MDNTLDAKPELKIFEQKLSLLLEKKNLDLEQIQAEVVEGRLSQIRSIQKKDKVNAKYEREKKEVEKNKKQYLFAVDKLKKSAIYCSRNSMLEKSSSKLLTMRKSFSVGNVFLKSILEDMALLEKGDLQQSSSSIIYRTVNPSLLAPDSQLSNELSSVVDKNNTEAMK